MEVVLVGILSSILSQVSKRSGFTGREISVVVSLVLAVVYFIIQMIVGEVQLAKLGADFLAIWGSATVFYDYIGKKILGGAK